MQDMAVIGDPTTTTSRWSLPLWTRTVLEAGLTPTEQAVAHALASYADHAGGSVRPGVANLAAVVGVSERTVSRALVIIRHRGLVERTSRSDRFRGLADVYRLVVSAAVRAVRSTATRVRPTNYSTTGGRPSPDRGPADLYADTVAGIDGLTPREQTRLAARARRAAAHGSTPRAVVAALTTPLPADTVSAAAVLHARLLNVEGLPEERALEWLAARLKTWSPRRRRTAAAPRSAEAFGPTTTVLTGW